MKTYNQIVEQLRSGDALKVIEAQYLLGWISKEWYNCKWNSEYLLRIFSI